jgi:hypothetical protein
MIKNVTLLSSREGRGSEYVVRGPGSFSELAVAKRALDWNISWRLSFAKVHLRA